MEMRKEELPGTVAGRVDGVYRFGRWVQDLWSLACRVEVSKKVGASAHG